MIKRERVPAGVRGRFGRLAATFAGDQRLAAVYLFGSFAAGREGPLSDVDVAVLLAEKVPAGQYDALTIDYYGEVAHALGTGEVSVVLLNRSSLPLRYEVVRGGRVLLDRLPAERLAFEVRTLDEYMDFKPLLDAYDDALLEQLATGRA